MSLRDDSSLVSEYALVVAGDGDEGYAQGLAVALSSALRHLPPGLRLEIVVLDIGLAESSHKRIYDVVEASKRRDPVTFIRIPAERLKRVSGRSRLGLATYSRLILGDLLPSRIRRAVYLDSDVLITRDVSPLFSINLDGALLAAVMNFGWDGTLRALPAVHGDSSRAYFNAGVMVLDMRSWRSARLGERALEYAAADEHDLALADQDALNAVVDRWYELDYEWNVQHGDLFLGQPPAYALQTHRVYAQRWELFHAAAVLHFTGGAKPWHHWSKVPGTRAWVLALLRAGWFTRGEAARWLLRRSRRRTLSSIKRAVLRLRGSREL